MRRMLAAAAACALGDRRRCDDRRRGPGDPCVSTVRTRKVVLDFFGVGSTAEPRTSC